MRDARLCHLARRRGHLTWLAYQALVDERRTRFPNRQLDVGPGPDPSASRRLGKGGTLPMIPASIGAGDLDGAVSARAFSGHS